MIQISHTVAQDGLPVATASPPYQGVGDFLTMEAYGLNSWPFREVLPQLDAIVRGEIKTFHYSGDAFEVQASACGASLLFIAVQPPVSLPLPLDEFADAIRQWQRFLSQVVV